MMRACTYAVGRSSWWLGHGAAPSAPPAFSGSPAAGKLLRCVQSKQVSPLPEEAAMLVLMRSFAVIVGILALVAASLYATLVVWERTHPPRLPTVSTAAPQPAVLYQSMPAKGVARAVR